MIKKLQRCDNYLINWQGSRYRVIQGDSGEEVAQCRPHVFVIMKMLTLCLLKSIVSIKYFERDFLQK